MPKRKSRLSDEKPSSSYTQDDMFDAMSLNKDIMKGVHDYGFEKLSENQLNGIEAFCSGKSVLHIAEYEPGNTTIFCVGILQQLDISTVKCQGLVLVHNLTLAEEIRIEMLQLGRLLNVKVDVVGLLKEVVDPVHVLVGRPYDVLKLMQQKPKKVDDIASKLMPQKPKKVDDIASKLMPPKLEKVDDIASKLMPPKLEKVDDVASKLMPPKLEKVDDIASKLMPQKPEKDDDIASKSMQQKRFDFDMVKILVLDEADKMHSLHLDMVDEIFKLLPLQCEDEFQVGVFTETMPEKVDDIARKLMNDPWEIEGKKPDELSVQSIKKHLFVNEGNAEKEENEEWKFSALYKLYKEMRTDTRKIIVYVDALERIDEVRDRIKNEYQHEFLAAHKFMDQNARNKMKKKFSEENGVLITNEMLARGIIDVEQVDLVVNFDLPRDYLRRVGRFKGVSVVSFVTNEDWYYLIDFQTDLGVVFEQHITSEPVTPLLEEFPIERDESIKHFVYNGANEDAKFDELVYFLGEKLGTIETVFFVDNCERVSQLAKQLEQLFEKRWEVTITTQSDENSIDISLEFKDLYECKSRVRIITDEQCHKIDVTKVPFVVHYNIPETTDVFNQRIAWCGSEGTAMYIPTDRNWSSVFRIQRSCKVVLKWFPESLDTLFIQRSSVKQIYDDLPSEEEKLCFLFCCLFPKEYDISEDELFHYLMGENLLTVMVDTFEAARLHLHAIIVKLTSLRLLLQDKSERIVMHDVVHDVAIRIASDSVEDHGFIVKAGMIERFPPLVDFHECKRLSFITKIGSHITCSTTDTIKAAHLSTLSFKGNVKLVELHDDFFKETPSLLTLDLSGTSIKCFRNPSHAL